MKNKCFFVVILLFISQNIFSQTPMNIQKKASKFEMMFVNLDFRDLQNLFLEKGLVGVRVVQQKKELISKEVKGRDQVKEWVQSFSANPPPWPNLRQQVLCQHLTCEFSGPALPNNIYVSKIIFQQLPNSDLFIRNIELISGE